MSKKVFIGVGHGGKDPGAIGNGMREADVNLTIALEMRGILKDRGFNVLLSRVSDVDDRLADEIARCNEFNPDVALEIHTNAGGGKGFEVYVPLSCENSKRLAEMIQESVTTLGRKSRGIKYNARLGWTKKVKSPCVLCEGFFIDGTEGAEMADKRKQRELAAAYAEGVLKYFGTDKTITNMRIVKEKYNFSDATMKYLAAYQFSDALFERLAE